MVTKLQHHNILDYAQNLRSNNVLIIAGSGDDAFYYQAQIGPSLGASSLTVFFHEGSRGLERIRLFGSMKVVMQFADKSQFFGELNLLPQALAKAADENLALELKILESAELDWPSDQCIMPMT